MVLTPKKLGNQQIDLRDTHGDTALLGAIAVRFADLRGAAKTVEALVIHGASIETSNDRGETALMWAARVGNPDAIRVLLKAGANKGRVDQAGHNARFYLRDARSHLTFDESVVRRYDQAESILGQE